MTRVNDIHTYMTPSMKWMNDIHAYITPSNDMHD